MKKLKIIVVVLLLLFLAGKLAFNYQISDRHKNYTLNCAIQNSPTGDISAGFAAVSITPSLDDTWNDTDNNAKYEPEKGDSYNDLNNNGKFDAYWLAGFHNKRAANGIHDSIWARTMILDDGSSRIAIVSLDAIGFFHDQVIDVRKKISPNLHIDYCMIASTHVHEAPDLMGIWGESKYKNGVNKAYKEFVINQTVRSITQAVNDLEPVTLHFAKNDSTALPLVKDTRPPIVYDPGMYLIQAKRNNGKVKGTLVSWANHPETLWSENLFITSDFPHYFREGIEKEFGGTCVYLNGAIGGLITTHRTLPLKNPVSGKEITAPTFEKAEALGIALAGIASKSLKSSTEYISFGKIDLQAQTFILPFENILFRLAAVAGIIDRGMTGKWQVRTEMAAWKIGPASFLTIPGEIYPEIINGGIEAPEGQDFQMPPLETPPLRELMTGKYKFVIGMANDELGYIIPKSEWDNEAPWIYGNKELYGEENSLGSETAPIIYKTATELLGKLN